MLHVPASVFSWYSTMFFENFTWSTLNSIKSRVDILHYVDYSLHHAVQCENMTPDAARIQRCFDTAADPKSVFYWRISSCSMCVFMLMCLTLSQLMWFVSVDSWPVCRSSLSVLLSTPGPPLTWPSSCRQLDSIQSPSHCNLSALSSSSLDSSVAALPVERATAPSSQCVYHNALWIVHAKWQTPFWLTRKQLKCLRSSFTNLN